MFNFLFHLIVFTIFFLYFIFIHLRFIPEIRADPQEVHSGQDKSLGSDYGSRVHEDGRQCPNRWILWRFQSEETGTVIVTIEDS